MRKLLLINPVGRRSGYLLKRALTFPPLSLAYVAAVTPAHWEVKIQDENIAPFRFESADLVGVTSFTSNITRAYELAEVYRAKGVKVVIGGIHVSMLPDEALSFADSVVIGEAEGVWQRVIHDFEADRLLPKYVGPRVRLERGSAWPRRDLLSLEYVWNSVQTSRGCPFNCSFCSVSNYLGKEFRQRGAEDVLNELHSFEGKMVAFLDDNLIGYSESSKLRAKRIFRGMIAEDLKKKWIMQTSLNAAEDEEVLELAGQAGCMAALVGFEAISDDTLNSMNKSVNLKLGVANYKKVLRAFHKHGIAVLGAYIVGNDYENRTYYEDLASSLVKCGVDVVQIAILTPLPGTYFMKQCQEEGRLLFTDFPRDWDKYRFSHIVHRLRGVDERTVYTGNNFVKRCIYSFPVYQYRLIRSLLNIRKLSSFVVTRKLNEAFKKAWQNSHYYRVYPKRF